ncbi:RagB/SusD family nutrient uptake outer membrane protein [Algoriphagus aquimarinus]|uniref:RagB/SusD family nutrient uptake outer membrane protein n=1 Tax=Algoriphagus aquimarinus TaxID=237018 RepID=A0A5C7AZS2_9BACT|nr:RagB/SusD family nutrient uptake outer membrane protein [Algoriphagus aquimarinus]TXE13694.1 RagB/SusD family nutrient uptake outer membrane protein [Algoriphagus aquimarinus]
MKKSTLVILLQLFLALAFTSCEEFLDTEPFDKLVPNTFFQTEKDLELYTNSFYQRMIPGGLEVVQSDELGEFTSKNQSPTFISGSYSSVNEGAWNWTDLRNINYFLENYNKEQIPEEARNHYAGIARFFRAWFYFDKVKRYGDVPWYDRTLATDDADLFKARDSRELVMDNVMADLNFAVENIRDTKDNRASMITRQVALAFKSRVALFEGTYRKYHTELGLAGSDEMLREAADAARMVMDAGRYSLYSNGAPESDYRNLFISENPISQEVMLAVVYNNSLRRWHNITWKFNSATYGARWGLNKQFINTYLMTDGSRFTEQAGFDEKVFVEEMENRDHRLAQTVRSLGYTRSDGSAAPPNFGYTYTGYHILKFSLDDKRYDGISEAYNSIPLIRYAEVLLNYAEAKAELGEFDVSVWMETIAPLRERAGVDPVIPSVADSYLQAVYFPEISDKYLLEVRRERGIELCYEGLRYDDLMRWKKGDLVEMSWKGIYVPALNTPMDLDGNGTPDVSFVQTVPATKVPGVIYFVIDGKASKLSEGTKGHLIWRDDEDREFPDKKYLHPISNTDIVLNPELAQNPGWD